MIILCIVCVVLGYNIYISYFHIDVTCYEIKSDKIENDVNIVMIADVHDVHCLIKDKVIERIQSLNPDLILCVGDIIDEDSPNDESMINFLKQLMSISTVYMSLGNHEVSFYEDRMSQLDQISEMGVHFLEEEYEDIELNGNAIRIGGMYDYAFSLMDGTITQEGMENSLTYQFLKNMTETDAFKLMMAHRPDSFIYCDAYQWDLDLIVSGHTHGGQVILPFIGGLYAPEQGFFPKVDYGQFSLGNTPLIVTRGVSSGNENLPRFNNPCEIVQITLTKA